MKTPKEIIKVIKITENSDGTANMEYEVSKEFRELTRKKLGVKRLTDKKLNEFVLDILTKATNEEDGYAFKKIET